jgi:arylsulfatase A-like enzyme
MSSMAGRVSIAALGSLLALIGATAPIPTAGAQAGNPPNVLIILTDDQRPTDTLEWMPKTMQRFGQGGTQYTNAFATNPVCCPARATIMTGRFAHNNRVRTNRDAALLNQRTTIQRYLQDRGYTTSILGKYLNGWPVANNPPFFDDWYTMDPEFCTTQFNNNGVVSTKVGYTTDLLADRAEDLIRNKFESNDATPWFMYVAPYAPHEPATAEMEKPGCGDDPYNVADFGPWPGNPAVFETDERDKPKYVQTASHTYEEALLDRQRQLRTLLSVDDLVDQIFDAIQDENEGDTLAFFLSDNGFFWSEHGLRGKQQPYSQAMQIPLLARWPNHIETERVDGRFVGNIDLAPTIMDAAGITPDPASPVDGRSLLNLAGRKKMLNESWNQGPRGPWASIRTSSYQYTEYYENDARTVEFREYYDMQLDPWQLTNLFNDGNPKNDPYIGALHRELAKARACRGTVGKKACTTLLDKPGIPIKCPGAKAEEGHHLVGSGERDRIGGISSRDVVCGLGGRDTLRGKGGNDLLLGGKRGDKLVGSGGHDQLKGAGGRDDCRGGPGKDTFKSCEKRKG